MQRVNFSKLSLIVKEATHHHRDAIVSQVELSQTVQALQVFHSGDVVPCQIQHIQFTQVRHIFYPGDLGEGRVKQKKHATIKKWVSYGDILMKLRSGRV